MMSAEDVREVLRLGPPELLRAVLDIVRLGGGKKMPARAPELVLRTMRHGEQRRRNPLRQLLGGFFVHGFGNSEGLGPDDCVRLLVADTAAEVLERAPGLRVLLGWGVPAAFVRWGLVRVVLEDRPLAVVALGLLAAEPAERTPGARAMWEAVREEHPELPARPAGVPKLRKIAAGGAEEPVPGPEELAVELDELRGRFESATDAAERTAARLRDGRRPEDGDLVLLHRVAADFDGLRTRIETVVPGDRPAELAALAAAVRAAAEAGRRDGRVRALRGIEGPDVVAGLLAEVRQAAGTGGEDDGLAVLAELIEVRAEDRLRAPALADRARAELPERWHRLIDVALMGELTIGADPGEPAPVETPAAPEPERVADDPRVTGVPAPREAPAVETVREGEDELKALDAFLEEAVPADPGPPPEPSGPRTGAGTPPAEEAAAEPGPAEREPAGAPDEAEAAALNARRFGLAGWLRKAAGRPDAEVNARWCAALAPETAVFAGPLSAEFAAAARELDAKALADDPAGGLLAWAAAIRAGLVHPEATRLVENLNVVVSRHTVLRECGEAFAQAARAGLYLSSGMGGWIRGAAELAQARGAAAREAARLLEEAPHRTIKLARATEVWKSLLLPDGVLRELLKPAAEDDPARAAEVAAQVVRLRGGAGVDRLIDETDARVNGPQKGKPIIAGARAKLHAWIDGALTTAGQWAVAVKEHEDAASGDRDWRTGPLQQLRDAIAGRRQEIGEALTAMADTAGEAAADAALFLLDGAFGLLDGAELAETEPPAGRVLHRDLLPAAALPVNPRTLEPEGEVAPADLAAVALAGPPDWAEVFRARAARLDHDGTQAVVSVLQTLNPDAAARLRARRDGLVRDARAARDERVEQVRDLIAMARRDGLLTEGGERGAEEAVRLLIAGDRHDFDRIGRELDALLARLERCCAASVEKARENAADFDGPDEFDAHSYRMVHLNGPDRAPLSIGQITGLLRPGRLVHVVAGSAALHAERVVASLEAMPSGRPDLEIRVVRPGEGTFDSAVLRARRHRGHDVIVLDLHAARDGEQFERRLAEARLAVADRSGEGTLAVVLVAGPASAAGWLRYAGDDDVELVPLRRLDPPAIRQWMLEDSFGFPDDAGQRELLRRTGGWPVLVGRVVTALAGRDRDQALENVLRQVRARPAAFLDDAGVGMRADPCLAIAWRVLVREDDRGTAEDLGALLTAYGEEDWPGLTPDALREHGYAGTGDLVEALRVLGALEPVDGALCCEPVLAEATRWAEGA